GSQPLSATGTPARTTGLANGSRWTGIVSIGAMALADVIALLGVGGRSGNTPLGFGAILGFPALVGGVVALVLGIIALSQARRLQTIDGRRHAAIGIVTGAMTFVLCCALFAIAGSIER